MNRFIPAILVNFAGERNARRPAAGDADIAGPNATERKIRIKLRRARALKRRMPVRYR